MAPPANFGQHISRETRPLIKDASKWELTDIAFITIKAEEKMTAFCLNTNFIIPDFIIKCYSFGCVFTT